MSDADIAALNYLGMRMAPPGSRSERALRSAAQRCLDGKLATLAQWEARQLPPVRFQGRQHLERALALGKGAIVALPHIGPYHRVPSELVLAGYPTLLLIDSPNYDNEVAAYAAWAAAYPGTHPDPMHYVNAQTPLATWQMLRGLQQGRVLCLWLDGNTGIDDPDGDKTTVPVAFCSRTLRVRKGAAFLSGRQGTPLVPAVIRETRSGTHCLNFAPAVTRATDEPLDTYCQRAMQVLYSGLEQAVRRDPACWEEWYHLHLWCEPEAVGAAFTPPDDPLDLLALRLTAAPEHLARFTLTDEGPVVAQTQTGAALAETPLVRALLRRLTAQPTVEELLDRLGQRYGEEAVLEAILVLATAGFALPLEEPQ